MFPQLTNLIRRAVLCTTLVGLSSFSLVSNTHANIPSLQPIGQDVLAQLSGVTAVAGYYAPSDGYQHVIAATSDGNVHEIYFMGGGQPIGQDVLAQLSGVTAVAGYHALSDGYQHVIAATSDGNVHEIYFASANPADPASSGAAPLDLVWNQTDPNGLPLNPKWGWQVGPHPGSSDLFPDTVRLCNDFPGNSLGTPPCTTQNPTYDVPEGFNAAICSLDGATKRGHGGVDGHVNWMPVTYTGPISWVSHSAPGTDDDYNFRLQPPDQGGLLAGNNGNLGLEFDSDQTIDHFHTPWWDKFHSAVDDSDSKAAAMVNGRPAVVIGLLGVDNEHTPATEIHPVWAIAVNVESTATDDVWAIFVRNWGNEGYCSKDNHIWNAQSITLQLPGRPQSTSVSVASGTTFKSNAQIPSPSVTFAPQGAGVYVSFTLPPPSAGARVNGELHLHWSGSNVASLGSSTLHAESLSISSDPATPVVSEGTAEDRVAAVVAALPPDKAAAYRAAVLPVTTHETDQIVVQIGAAQPIADAVAQIGVSLGPAPPTGGVLLDDQKAADDKRRAAALCAAFNNHIPNFPANACPDQSSGVLSPRGSPVGGLLPTPFATPAT